MHSVKVHAWYGREPEQSLELCVQIDVDAECTLYTLTLLEQGQVVQKRLIRKENDYPGDWFAKHLSKTLLAAVGDADSNAKRAIVDFARCYGTYEVDFVFKISKRGKEQFISFNAHFFDSHIRGGVWSTTSWNIGIAIDDARQFGNDLRKLFDECVLPHQG